MSQPLRLPVPARYRAFFEDGLRFGMTSIFSAGLSLGLPAVFHEVLRLDEELAVGGALAICFFVNYFVARFFVFRSEASVLRTFLRFASVSVVLRVFEYLAFLVLFRVTETHYLVVHAAVLVVSLIIKFFAHRHFTFG